MNNWLQQAWNEGPPVSVGALAFRLLCSLAAGLVVAWIYRLTRKDNGSAHLPSTLVLLAVLIAAVTQVIGDNVARAFSLVGALSIVRFRTVVRDTRDTAFVIFAVVAGMAVGAGRIVVAVEAVIAVSLGAWLMERRGGILGTPRREFDVVLRTGIGVDIDAAAGGILGRFVASRETIGAATARQGASMDYTFRVRLNTESRPEEIVRALNAVDGVESVELRPVED